MIELHENGPIRNVMVKYTSTMIYYEVLEAYVDNCGNYTWLWIPRNKPFDLPGPTVGFERPPPVIICMPARPDNPNPPAPPEPVDPGEWTDYPGIERPPTQEGHPPTEGYVEIPIKDDFKYDLGSVIPVVQDLTPDWVNRTETQKEWLESHKDDYVWLDDVLEEAKKNGYAVTVLPPSSIRQSWFGVLPSWCQVRSVIITPNPTGDPDETPGILEGYGYIPLESWRHGTPADRADYDRGNNSEPNYEDLADWGSLIDW
jgi:hypothetical protein